MKRTHILFLLILCSAFFLSACKQKSSDKNAFKKHLTINIQPFEDFSMVDSKFIQSKILEIYPYVTVSEKISFPKNAYVSGRNRFRADSLIRFLQRINKKGQVTVGLTNFDISTSKNNIDDWGVMGLGFRPGTSSIASTFRLDKKKKLEQLFKVAVHELGHTQGLPHCEVKTCLMRDAKGKNPTDEEKDFCDDCKNVLKRKGWF
jgi:archaemetzincin